MRLESGGTRSPEGATVMMKGWEGKTPERTDDGVRRS